MSDDAISESRHVAKDDLALNASGIAGYRFVCSCGYESNEWYPIPEGALAAAEDQGHA